MNMKKSKRRNLSLKSRRRRSQKVWKMRGCSSRRAMVCAMCHCKCNKNGMCPMCRRKCVCGKSTRRIKYGGTPDVPLAFSNNGVVPSVLNPHYAYPGLQKGGTPDVPLAYSNNGVVPSVLNPHYAYPGLQKGGGYVDIPSPLAPINAEPLPQPSFVGAPWGGAISQWPGVSAPHDGNYLAQNLYKVQPEMNPVDEQATNVLMGGRRRRNRKGGKLTKRRMRGGDYGIFSQLKTDLTNTYRAWNGDSALPNPLPYKDQMFFGRNAQDNLNYLKVR
jgi:hypothetical protein